MSHLIEVQFLKQYFTIKNNILGINKKVIKALDDVSFYIDRGETLGLVGESGSGKTTLGRTLLHIYNPTSGNIFFNGEQITEKNYKKYYKNMQIIFQDPYSSLNPRMTIEDIVGEALDIHKLYNSKKDRRDRVLELLNLVGLNSEHSSRYPHEFSGGQRQRIGIARALSVNPDFIVCDEPVSALDVSIQAQIVNMLKNMQDKLNLTYLFISHDLSVIRQLANRVAVMYLGNIVEIAKSDDLYKNPIHPYTKSLISSIPVPKLSKNKESIILSGEIPSPIDPPSGCKFRTRCPYVKEICREKTPELMEIANEHYSACHLV